MTSIVSVAGQLAGDLQQPHSGEAVGVLYSLFS